MEKGKKLVKRVAWADEVGGELLTVWMSSEDDVKKVAGEGRGIDEEVKMVAGSGRSIDEDDDTRVTGYGRIFIRDQKRASAKEYQKRGTPGTRSDGRSDRERVSRTHDDDGVKFDSNDMNKAREQKRVLNVVNQKGSTRNLPGGLRSEGRCREEGDGINCAIKDPDLIRRPY